MVGEKRGWGRGEDWGEEEQERREGGGEESE